MAIAQTTAGQRLFIVLFLTSTLAFSLSVAAVALCDFSKRNVQLTLNATEYCDTTVGVEYGRPICQVLFALNHSVGFFGFFAPMPSSGSFTCFSYNQVLNELDLDDAIDYSPTFEAAQTFAVLAAILGGLGFMGLLLVICACSTFLQHCMRWFSLLYLLATVCQGLSFLLLDSHLCSARVLNDILNNYKNETELEAVAVMENELWVSTVSCGPSRGFRLAIAAIVFYSLSIFLTFRAVAVTVYESLQRKLNDGDDTGNGPLVEESGTSLNASASKDSFLSQGQVIEESKT